MRAHPAHPPAYGPADAYRMLTSGFQLPQEPRERSIANIFFNCSDKLVRGTNITVTLCILTTWLLHNQIIITKANLTPDHFLTSTKSPKIHSGDFVTSYTKTLGKNIII